MFIRLFGHLLWLILGFEVVSLVASPVASPSRDFFLGLPSGRFLGGAILFPVGFLVTVKGSTVFSK